MAEKPRQQLVLSTRTKMRDTRWDAISAAPAKLATRDDFREEIGRLWGEAQERFLLIGRMLNQAKEALPHGEFEAMVASELPFTPATARKLRAVAYAVDTGVLPAESLPPSYTTVFELASLSDNERRAAAEAGLFRRNVRREEVVAFKRQLRASSAPGPEERRATLEVERERLLRRLAEIEAELNGLEQ